jgi:hypothetical protein
MVKGRKGRALSMVGVLFWVSDDQSNLLSWAIEMRAVWRAELGGGA